VLDELPEDEKERQREQTAQGWNLSTTAASL
jgi:hypothetical protein